MDETVESLAWIQSPKHGFSWVASLCDAFIFEKTIGESTFIGWDDSFNISCFSSFQTAKEYAEKADQAELANETKLYFPVRLQFRSKDIKQLRANTSALPGTPRVEGLQRKCHSKSPGLEAAVVDSICSVLKDYDDSTRMLPF